MLNLRSKISVAVVVLTTMAWIVSCAVNPVSGKRELMLMSEAEEIQLGASYDPQVIQTYGLYDDKKISDFVTRVGTEMAAVSHRSHLQFHFRVVDTPVINAFAVPGGYVYITRGILAHLNSEAEFAGVMGHEIGHVTARHTAKQQSKAQLAQLGLGIGSVVSESFAQFAGLAQTGLSVLFLKHGRDAERESDALGVEYSTKIGYDAKEMANFFGTLSRMRAAGGGAMPDWLSTHPNPADRVVDVTNMAKERQATMNTGSLKINRDQFLNLIDGIIYGEDPHNGYVADGSFFHPGLKFQFPVPAGWNLVNMPSQVQMANQEGNAAILFTLTEASSSIEAANKFAQESGATVSDRKTLKVNGLDAHRLLSSLNTEQGPLGVLSYFIAYGSNIYVFHGYSVQDAFSGLLDTFESTMKNFNSLSDPARINIQPERIRVKQVKATGTLQQALQSYSVPQERWEEHSLINGMMLDEQVSRNTKIKIAAR